MGLAGWCLVGVTGIRVVRRVPYLLCFVPFLGNSQGLMTTEYCLHMLRRVTTAIHLLVCDNERVGWQIVQVSENTVMMC